MNMRIVLRKIRGPVFLYKLLPNYSYKIIFCDSNKTGIKIMKVSLNVIDIY